MMLKTLSLTLVPIALAGAWYAASDRGEEIDATLARPTVEDAGRSEELASVELRDRTPRAALETDAAVVTAHAADGSATTGATDGAPARARVEGHVVDALTGEPVPFVDVIVVETVPYADGGLRSVSATTDATGAFVDPFSTLPVGSVEVTILDGHGGIMTGVQKQVLAFPFEASLEARVGPTFRLDLPADHDVREERFTVRYALPGAKYKNRPIETNLRLDGETPWIRFGPMALDLDGDGPWTLQIKGAEGIRMGSARVDRKFGIEPFPVRFDMDNRGAIEFSLALGDGAQLPAARVDVHPVGDEEKVVRVFLGQHDADGTMRGHLRYAIPGRYVWAFGIDGGGTGGEVDVVAGEVTRVGLSLDDVGETFDTHVLLDLTAAPGANPQEWMTFVVREDDPSSGFMTRPTRDSSDPDGYWRIELESLVDGRWTIGVNSGSEFDVEPGSVSVGPGDPTAVIKATPGAPRVPVRVTAVDAKTGERIRGAEAVFMASITDTGTFQRAENGGLEPEPLRANEETTIIVRAGGYRATPFLHDPARDGGELEARLERGWSNRVIVIEMAKMELVAGVSVHVDGEFVGRTGDDGTLWMTADGPPDLIEVGKGDAGVEVNLSPFHAGAVAPLDGIGGYAFAISRR